MSDPQVIPFDPHPAPRHYGVAEIMAIESANANGEVISRGEIQGLCRGYLQLLSYLDGRVS
jgi:hypothetical protein